MKKVTLKRGKIKLSRLFKSEFQTSGTLTAEFKQDVEKITVYSGQVNNGFSDDIFGQDLIGKETEYKKSETRTAWYKVDENTSVEQVTKMLEANPNISIQKILSNAPILDDGQKEAIKSGLTTLDQIAENQACKYGDGENEGEYILRNGNPIYKVTCVRSNVVEDVNDTDSEPYLTEVMKVLLEPAEKIVNSLSDDLF
jgi:hypothetical protein